MNKIIELLKYIIIAIIQGISEIFPISSSGHLTILYTMFNIDDEVRLNLTIFLHLASSAALCMFYKEDLLNLIKNTFLYIFKKDKSKVYYFKLFIYLIIGSIPAVIVGFFIKPLIEKMFSNILFVSFGFLLTAIILMLSKFNNNKSSYTLNNTLITGIFQSLAMFPGVSRSGMTLFGSKISKMDYQSGKKFTFLLLIPISIGSTFLSFFDNTTFIFNNLYLYLIAFIITFISTFISLKLFINKVKYKHNIYFSTYLFIISFFIFYYIFI